MSWAPLSTCSIRITVNTVWASSVFPGVDLDDTIARVVRVQADNLIVDVNGQVVGVLSASSTIAVHSTTIIQFADCDHGDFHNVNATSSFAPVALSTTIATGFPSGSPMVTLPPLLHVAPGTTSSLRLAMAAGPGSIPTLASSVSPGALITDLDATKVVVAVNIRAETVVTMRIVVCDAAGYQTTTPVVFTVVPAMANSTVDISNLLPARSLDLIGSTTPFVVDVARPNVTMFPVVPDASFQNTTTFVYRPASARSDVQFCLVADIAPITTRDLSCTTLMTIATDSQGQALIRYTPESGALTWSADPGREFQVVVVGPNLAVLVVLGAADRDGSGRYQCGIPPGSSFVVVRDANTLVVFGHVALPPTPPSTAATGAPVPATTTATVTQNGVSAALTGQPVIVVVGAPFIVTVNVRDGNGQIVADASGQVQCTLGNGQTSSGAMAGGIASVSMSPTSLGQMPLTCTLLSQTNVPPVVSSVTVVPQPGDPSLATTTVTMDPVVVVGQTATVTVQARTATGDVVTDPLITYAMQAVAVDGHAAIVDQLQTAACRASACFQWTPTMSVAYTVTIVTRPANLTIFVGHVQSVPGAVARDRTVVGGSATLPQAAAGATLFLVMQARDAYGNPVTQAQAQFAVSALDAHSSAQLASPALWSQNATDADAIGVLKTAGAATAGYWRAVVNTPASAGAVRVTVKLNGADIYNGDVSIGASPATIPAYVIWTALVVAVAGVAAALVALTRKRNAQLLEQVNPYIPAFVESPASFAIANQTGILITYSNPIALSTSDRSTLVTGESSFGTALSATKKTDGSRKTGQVSTSDARSSSERATQIGVSVAPVRSQETMPSSVGPIGNDSTMSSVSAAIPAADRVMTSSPPSMADARVGRSLAMDGNVVPKGKLVTPEEDDNTMAPLSPSYDSAYEHVQPLPPVRDGVHAVHRVSPPPSLVITLTTPDATTKDAPPR
ncbi:Ig-like domain-containing protein [Plasmodiophora brassicae]